MSTLLVIKGPKLGVRYQLGDSTRIGRGHDNEIQVSDPNVSRLHAEIVRRGYSYSIFDCDSKNGLSVNGTQVKEKVLLRNDELTIGATVFLFNSDLSISNPLFTASPVYMYPADNDTIVQARRGSQLDSLSGPDRASIEFLLRFADLFSAPPAPLAETAERLMSQVQLLFMADIVVLLMRESTTGDLRPVVALPSDKPVRLNQSLISTVARDQTPLILSEDPTSIGSWEEPPKTAEAEEDTIGPYTLDEAADTRHDRLAQRVARAAAGSLISSGLSTICAPIIVDGETVGIIAVEKYEKDFFSLRDLGLLQAVVRLAAGTLLAARMADRIAQGGGGETTARVLTSRSSQVTEIYTAAERAAEAGVTVLITGESGTGKEILARHIHDSSARRAGPFVALNCSAIPATLFESELFGYERGAFTGAQRTTPGKVEAARGGTIFLDEIGDLDMALQPKLLRYLQERVFYRVGGNRAIESDARIVAATNRDLEDAVRSGGFRQDLLYRLNVMQFHLPPLRERREDIPALLDYFIAKISARVGGKILGASDAAIALLQTHDWPGNIRELENAVERAMLLANSKILTPVDFAWISRARGIDPSDPDAFPVMPIAELEKRVIVSALKQTNGNQVRAAELLGIHRNTLRNKIAEYQITTTR